jgi:hypothetical protein
MRFLHGNGSSQAIKCRKEDVEPAVGMIVVRQVAGSCEVQARRQPFSEMDAPVDLLQRYVSTG